MAVPLAHQRHRTLFAKKQVLRRGGPPRATAAGLRLAVDVAAALKTWAIRDSVDAFPLGALPGLSTTGVFYNKASATPLFTEAFRLRLVLASVVDC